MENTLIKALNIPQVCEATGFSKSKVYDEIKAGNLPARKAGKRTLVLIKDLQAYLDNLPRAYAAAA